MNKIKSGYLFAVPYKIVRPVIDGEEYQWEDGTKTNLLNLRGNLFFAVPAGKGNHKQIIICTDSFQERSFEVAHRMGVKLAQLMRLK